MNTKNKRPIDRVAENTYSWLGKTFVLIKKTKVKTWQGIFIIAFVTGILIAIISMISMDVQIKSKATGETASLSISPASVKVNKGSSFNLDVLLNTNGSNAVVAKAVVKYNTGSLQLLGWNTDNSAFANTSCVYNGKSCEIINNNPATGEISIALAKPTPGVNTVSGKVATLNFKLLDTAVDNSVEVFFSGPGAYDDSDVIFDNKLGTDILSGRAYSLISAITVPTTCTSFTYSSWSICQSNGTQTRIVASSSPTGCTGGTPVLTQNCTYTAPACTSYTYSSFTTCQPDGTQSRTVTSSAPTGCVGGTAPVLTQTCTYSTTSPTCTSFTYSSFGACQSNGTQMRTILSATPTGCVGGTPILTKTCKYNPNRKNR